MIAIFKGENMEKSDLEREYKNILEEEIEKINKREAQEKEV